MENKTNTIIWVILVIFILVLADFTIYKQDCKQIVDDKTDYEFSNFRVELNQIYYKRTHIATIYDHRIYITDTTKFKVK